VSNSLPIRSTALRSDASGTRVYAFQRDVRVRVADQLRDHLPGTPLSSARGMVRRSPLRE
jgi:hypothetical protein